MKTALITGITGQDGSYLAELLLDKGYSVHAIMRRSSVFTTSRIEHIMGHPNLKIGHGDLSDGSNVHRLLSSIQPDEIYNLAAQSHVAVSFEVPEYTADVDALGPLRILDAMRDLKLSTKFYQASTSELFGGIPGTEPQNEDTPFEPRSPYAAAKLYAYWLTKNYREAYGLFACNGILFNHESPRRGQTFVTKKVTQAVARISTGSGEVLYLGNLDAKRDWGHAKEYVEAMWLMLQQDAAKDYVIATGKAFTVREFVEMAFAHIGTQIDWRGSGADEKGYDAVSGDLLVAIDPKYYRPTEVEFLLGDASKARQDLNWSPKISLQELVSEMVDYDMHFDGYGGQL